MPNTKLYPNEARKAGRRAYKLAQSLFPIPRSLTGPGVVSTLERIDEELNADMSLHQVPSGTKVCDWTIPPEWSVSNAYIVSPDGERFAQFSENPLHLVGYSVPVNKTLSLDSLQEHLYSLPSQPNAIPYITSYYERRWGFCISHKERESLPDGKYQVVVETELDEEGSLTYGECKIPGQSEKEVFISTYICHPNLANNELSGPCVTTQLANWLAAKNRRRYTYRIVYAPETIGALAYIDSNLAALKDRVRAAFNVTCVGDDRTFSFMPTRTESTLVDRVGEHVLHHLEPNFDKYDYTERGSDERQYNSPRVDLPIVSLMRSKYGTYPEYHTSHDDMDIISPSGLAGGYAATRRAIQCLEQNTCLTSQVQGEPNLGSRDLYPTLSTTTADRSQGAVLLDILAYSDGDTDLLEIADKLEMPMWDLLEYVDILIENDLVCNT
jgi:aminopeptidase-like protein